ncbi:MAG: TonB-dependent receptor [Acidobacteria bacterium]|nr:TonB-dependent receptor [Acidobacteriota bacterium]
MCFAQAQETDIGSLSLEELLAVEVTTTSRNPEPIQRAPGSITVFNRKELDQMGISNLTELLSLVTGVQALFEPQEGRTNLLLGRGTPESYGQGFLLLLDGERLNENYTGGFSLTNRMVTLSNVKRVEIIRGPASALYGSNAFSGVINLISDVQTKRNWLGLGADGFYRLGTTHSESFGDWHVALFGEVFGEEGQTYHHVFDRFGLQDHTQDPHRGTDAQVRVSYQKAQLTLRHSDRHFEDFIVLGRVADGTNKEFTREQFARFSYQFGSDDLPINLAISQHGLTWKPFARLVQQGESPFDAAPWDLGATLNLRCQAISLNTHWASKWGLWNAGLIGEWTQIPKASSLSNYDPIDLTYVGHLTDFNDPIYRFVEDQDRSLYGLYFQNQKQWRDWTSTLGARYDHYNDIGGHVSPRMALVYAPKSPFGLKILWGQAFRAPGLGDLYDRDAGTTIGNPDLDPIQSETWEMSTIWTSTHSRLSTTGFLVKIDHLLSDIPLPNGGTLITNVGENHSNGLELEWTWLPSEMWLFRLSATAILHNESRHIPSESAFVAEDYAPDRYGSWVINWQQSAWNINLNGYWRNDIPIIQHGRAEHLNAAVKYQFNPKCSLRFRLDNVFDTQHAIPARGSGLGVDADGNRMRNVPTRGRSWSLTFVWSL